LLYKFKTTLVLVIICFIGCTNNSRITGSITKEEYDIYSIVIDSLYNRDSDSVFILPDSTERNYFSENYRGFKNGKWFEMNELDCLKNKDSIWVKSDCKELSNDYKASNEKYFTINISQIKSSVKICQLSTDALHKIFNPTNKDGWTEFYKLFPNAGGILHFSRIGFNTRRDQAVLYHSCGKSGLDGVGFYILLHKINSVWRIKVIAESWIS